MGKWDCYKNQNCNKPPYWTIPLIGVVLVIGIFILIFISLSTEASQPQILPNNNVNVNVNVDGRSFRGDNIPPEYNDCGGCVNK